MPRGARYKIVTPQDNQSLDPAGGTAPSHISDAITVLRAESIALTINHKLTCSNSTSLDVLVFASSDGIILDDTPYTSFNLGAQDVMTRPITVGPYAIKVKVENKDSVNATVVTTKLIIIS